MIQLIQNIQGNFVTEIKGNIIYLKGVEAEIQREDYINIYGLKAFLQNFSKTPITRGLVKPDPFGYKPPVGIIQKDIEISY
jgi:hypothetical protein